MLIHSSIIALALQVGPNPVAPPPGAEEEMLNRPPRETALEPELDEGSQWLVECLDLLGEDASRAHTMAQLQRNATTGTDRVLANHCLGPAATELSLWEDAATAFRAARDETPDDEPSARARFGIMAGNAVLASGDAERAVMLLDLAQDEAQRASNATLEAIAFTDMARAMVASSRPEEALAQLDKAIALDPENPENWLLTATLLRRLDRLGEAQDAIERASTLAPGNALIGLEAGVIAVLAGRDDAARASWQSVIEIAPDSEAARTARDYLAQLGPPQPQAQDAQEEPS